MRVIAGFYRGRKLKTLDGLKTRPTLNSTKEAIFSSLGGYLPEMITLELFGGCGALSIEALSRGVKNAFIVDNNSEAIKIIRNNAEILQNVDDLKIIHGDSKLTLLKLAGKLQFDIIFMDPPYELKIIDEMIELIIEHKLVKDGGYIVAEYYKGDVVEKNYEGFSVKLSRRYASSEILILEKN